MQPTLRVLEPSEFYQVAEVYAKVFTGPLPDNGWIVVAELGDRIVAFSCLQQIWHAEPTWVDTTWRGSTVFSRILFMIKRQLPKGVSGVLVTTTDNKMSKFLDSIGLDQVKGLFTFRWLRS